jgi:hypothetical protein
MWISDRWVFGSRTMIQVLKIGPSFSFCSHYLFSFFRGQSTAEVKYEIIAEVYQQPNSMFHTNITATKDLVIESSTTVTDRHDTSLQLPPETVPVTGCCCSRKGTMALETKFHRTTVAVHPSSHTRHDERNTNTTTNTNNNNDEILIEFRAQNKSTESVSAVRVRLVETIEWTAHGHKEVVKTVLGEIRLDASQFPELDRFHRRPTSNTLRRSQHGREYTGIRSAGDGDGSLQDLPWRTVGPMKVPPRAKDTYRGRTIEVRHVLTLELLTKGCCTTNPDSTSMIEIYRHLADSYPHLPTNVPTGGGGDRVGRKNNRNEYGTPSAPVEDGPSSSTPPSAPSHLYDDQDDAGGYPHAVASPAAGSGSAMDGYYYPTPFPDLLVEAEALPPDWNAQTAEVVTIPMADAIVLLDPPLTSSVQPSAPPRSMS